MIMEQSLANAQLNEAIRLLQGGQPEPAQKLLLEIAQYYPQSPEVQYFLGFSCSLRDEKEKAIAYYDEALSLRPDYIEVHNNRGVILNTLHRYEEALASFDRAIELKPEFSDLFFNRGIALQALKRLDEALANFDRAIELKPDYVDAFNSRGNVLNELKRYDEGLASYDQAIALKPDHVYALYNRGAALQILKRYDQALASYDRVIALQPDFRFVASKILNTKMYICEWAGFQDACKALLGNVMSGKKAAVPLVMLAINSNLEQQRRGAETYAIDRCMPSSHMVWQGERYRNRKIRIGYFSCDFREHPVSYLTAGLFETHDRSKFEVFAFSFGPLSDDPLRARLVASFDHFYEVSIKSDRDIANLAKELQIDIAIDLTGHTNGARIGIFANRAAPVQVNYLSYPGSMGAKYMDYIIGDYLVIPEESRSRYSEKIVYLPHTFQVNDSKRQIARAPTRPKFGLDDSSFIYCCFNQSSKFTPDVFKVWMKILQKVPNSILWLIEAGTTQVANLKKFSFDCGVLPDRLIFSGKLPYSEHLARYQLADIVLDTMPFNGGTTTSDALWGRAPVLTCIGETFAGRMSASLLTAICLPELITHSLQDYEEQAVDLATHPAKLRAIKQKLARNRLTTPLFDTKRFTKNIEKAYEQMYQRYQAGLPPDHINVTNQPM